MPTDASGSKSKERGFKICRGIVRNQTEVRLDPRSHANALGELRFTRQIHQVRESAEQGGNPLAFNREQD
jgi:hypothetical protein